MSSDGTNVRRLTTNKVTDARPAWSPDGRSIVFQSELAGAGGRELYLVRPDGTPAQQLSEGGARWAAAPDAVREVRRHQSRRAGRSSAAQHPDVWRSLTSSGAGGSDRVTGLIGEIVDGGPGNDRLDGGPGNDTLKGAVTTTR